MMTDKQKTIKSPVTLEGVGLHTGKPTILSIHPAPANHGYKFQRIDVEGEPIIVADVSKVTETQRGTTLEQNGTKMHTTEHVLAAVYASGIDNALIKGSTPTKGILKFSLSSSMAIPVAVLHATTIKSKSNSRSCSVM